MERAATHLIGEHDFSSFRSSMCQSPTPIKTLREINEGLMTRPRGFTIHKKLERTREKRWHALDEDWGDEVISNIFVRSPNALRGILEVWNTSGRIVPATAQQERGLGARCFVATEDTALEVRQQAHFAQLHLDLEAVGA